METIHRTGNYYGDNSDNHIFEMIDEGNLVGELYIHRTEHLIMNVEVNADRQGEGIARTLYETAVDTLGTVYHVPEWGCTEDGAAFAEAMGGDVMDDETAAEILGMDLSVLGY